MRPIALALMLLSSGCAALRPRPGGPQAHAERGWRAWLDGDADAAARELAAAPAADAYALFGRALLAHDRGESARAFDLWTAVLEGAARHARDPWWRAFAGAAAYRLAEVAGEAPEARAHLERLRALDDKKLPRPARALVLGTRAALSRRLGDFAGAQALERARGCPDRWFVAGSYGTLPRLDLSTPFAADGDADRARLRSVPAHGCTLPLEGGGSGVRSGVLYAVGWFFAARPADAAVEIGTDAPWRLFVDGGLAYDNLSPARVPPRVRRLVLPLAAGWHRLALKVAAPGGRAEAVITVEADPPLAVFDGEAKDAPSTPKQAVKAALAVTAAPPATTPTEVALAAYLAAEAAARVGDVDAAEAALARLIERAPRFAPAEIALAGVRAQDNTRPSRLARDRSRRAFERALALDASLLLAEERLAALELEANKPREALARLAAVKRAPNWRFPFDRFSALKQRGWQAEADRALAEARRMNPEACPAIEAELGQRRERHDVRGALELARRTARACAESDELADLLRAMGDKDGAIAEYRRLLAVDAMRESYRAGLAETLVEAGKDAAAAVEYAALVARYPRASHYRQRLADSLFAIGERARAKKVLEDGLAETPESQELHRALAAICPAAGAAKGAVVEKCPSILDPFRVDGKTVIAEFERDKSRPRWDAPAVIVLDRTVTRVFATGARLTLTHNIIRVNNKDGIDKFGEVTIPAEADVLTLRAIKADGSTREPEELIEKESVSVPDLEPGDYVEFEYVDPAPPPGAFPGGFLAERFYFRSYDAPLYRSEYVVAAPKTMKLQVDRRGERVPAAAEREEGELAIHTFATRLAPQAWSEPASTPFAEFMPSVRVGAGLSALGWRNYLVDGELLAWRADGELARLAAAIVKGKTSAADRLRAVDAWTRRHVKGSGALDEPATSIIARGEGNRITVIAALLAAAGVPSQLWLAHSQKSAELEGELPDLEGYDEPLLYAAGMFVDPRWRHGAAGFVSPPLRGARAFRLAPGKLERGTVTSDNPDTRRMDFDVRLAADGAGEVSVREELRGWPAVEWREALEKLEPDRVRPEFEQHTLGFHFPGASLIALTWKGADDDAAPFVVSYRFRAPQLARKKGRGLVLSAPFAAQLAKRYVGVSARKTPLQVDYAPPTLLHARIALPERTEAALPSPVRAEAPFGSFEQAASAGVGAVELQARFVMSDARLGPADYRVMVDFAERVDRAEAKALEIRPK